MTTFVDFIPSTSAPFQFQPTLDGTQYIVTVTWNVFGQRYYVNVNDLTGNLILARALTPGGPSLQVSLTWGNGVATASSGIGHNVPVGSVAAVRVSNSNSGFDGQFSALSVNATDITYSLPTNPNEPVPITGTLNFDLDLLGGYGVGSLWFHEDTQQFEF